MRGLAFNFSTESPLSVLELTLAILAACGRPDLEPVIEDVATHEIQAQYLAAGRARSLLGWQPRHELADALARTVAWYRHHLGEGVRRAA